MIWMGSQKYMYEQIKAKLAEGFTCIKMKIGAIDFEKELSLLSGFVVRIRPRNWSSG